MAQKNGRGYNCRGLILYCIVCRAAPVSHYTTIDAQTYWRCAGCHSIFLDQTHYPSKRKEQAHYLQHDNRVDDPAYRKFLSRLADPLLAFLKPSDKGLDFGCGSGPALATMLNEKGFSMQLYDPFFYPDKSVLKAHYDFITCTETAEHFHDPFAEFDRLDSLLKPKGHLGVMTCFLEEGSSFETWHYRRDPTHIVFYCETSFQVIAAQRKWYCQIPSKDIVIFSKK